MPVEINELVIRAVVERPAETGGPAAAEGAASRDRDALVDECVAAVLKILRRAKER